MEVSDNSMEAPSQRVTSIDELLEDLESDELCTSSYRDGLLQPHLERLVEIITLPSELDQGSLGKLIKNLYPAVKVRDNIVIRVVACLGHGQAKPPFAIQVALLKWLVLVYEVLEDSSGLSRLYTALFNLLDTVAIRPHLCHILALITRRKHVRPYRIQGLMELTRHAGNEPSLVGLMRVYKDYYPDVIVGDSIAGRAAVFTYPDREWRQRLDAIQAVHTQGIQHHLRPEPNTFRVLRVDMNGKPRSQESVIPNMYTANAHEDTITLEEVDRVTDLVRNLEKIQLPNQLVAVFGNTRLRRFLQLKSSDVTVKRIDNWLTAFFEDQLQSFGPDLAITEMLSDILGYTRLTKKPPLASFIYIKSILPIWNGIIGREVILELLTYLPMDPRELFIDEYEAQPSLSQFHKAIFQQLEDAILQNDTLESRLTLLKFYQTLHQQWTRAHVSNASQDTSIADELILHVNNLAHAILQGEDLTISTTSSAILFYESSVALISDINVQSKARVIMPPATLIYALYFSSSLNTISRLCALLALYKRAFEAAQLLGGSAMYPKSYVNLFNGFIMDICNSIWRSRAFSTADPNSAGCLLNSTVFASLSAYISSLNIRAGDAANAKAVELKELFGLSFGPLTCRFAIETVRQMEDEQAETGKINIRHAGPVTLGSLRQLGIDGGLKLEWKDYRGGVLRFMETKGITGVGELMYSTMKILRDVGKSV